MFNNRTISAYALGILTGSAITGAIALAAPAKADPVNGAERAVCVLLDETPTFQGIEHTGSLLEEKAGLTDYQAGEFIAQSVKDYCPEHTQLILDFVATYAPTPAQTKQLA